MRGYGWMALKEFGIGGVNKIGFGGVNAEMFLCVVVTELTSWKQLHIPI